jgi:hypothetical protein
LGHNSQYTVFVSLVTKSLIKEYYMSDTVSKTDIKQGLLALLKKTEANILQMQAKEAKGLAKLEKRLKKDEALPNLCKDDMVAAPVAAPSVAPAEQSGGAICVSCTGSNLEPLGDHMGMAHHICKDCGEVGQTIREQNEAAEVEAAQEGLVKQEFAAGGAAAKGGGPMAKPMVKSGLPDKKLPTVNSVKQAVGLSNKPKIPSIKKPSVPTAGATAPKKDAFNTGGKNPISDSFAKKAAPMSDVDLNDGEAREGTKMPKAGKKVDAPGSGGEILRKDFKAMDQKVAAAKASAPAPVTPPPASKPAPQSPYGKGINMQAPPPKREYDPVDPANPSVRSVANKKLATIQGPAMATSVATIRQRFNSGVNDKVQQTKRNSYHDIKRHSQGLPAAQPAPVAKSEEALAKAGIPSAPKAPKAPEAKATTTPAATLTVKNPNVTPTGTPTANKL